MKTKTQKKTLKRVNKKPWAGPNNRGVSPKGCQMTMEDKISEKEKFWDWNERMMGWLMTRVVMMTLTRWDDHGSMVSQEEVDQDVADEVSEAVDSRDEVMHSERNDW